MKKYTVIGYYTDNDQPWIEHVKAEDPKHATQVALDSCCYPDSMAVVEVIKGRHMGVLQNEEIVRADQ